MTQQKNIETLGRPEKLTLEIEYSDRSDEYPVLLQCGTYTDVTGESLPDALHNLANLMIIGGMSLEAV